MSPTGLKKLMPDRPFGAVCLGFATCDYLCLVPGFPPRGQKTYISRMVIDGGGQAATAACLLSRLGHKTAFVGVCGDDEAGLKIKPWFDEYGVDSSGLVLRPGESSLQSFIMVEEGGGERTIICHHGSCPKLTPQELDPEMIAKAQVLHLDGHFIQASLEAARMAKRHGVLISMDGERIFPETKELVSLCDVVVGCHDFAQRLTGKTDPQDALRALAALGPAWAGRTMGAEGAELLAAGRLYRQPPFKCGLWTPPARGMFFTAVWCTPSCWAWSPKGPWPPPPPWPPSVSEGWGAAAPCRTGRGSGPLCKNTAVNPQPGFAKSPGGQSRIPGGLSARIRLPRPVPNWPPYPHPSHASWVR